MVFDHGRPTAAGWADVPKPWLAQLEPRGTQISPAETLGPGVALATWPSRLQDRDVLFFCDNQGAVHSLAGGVASAMDLQALVSATQAALAHWRVRWYIEYVPTLANVSDGLSRLGNADPWCAEHGLTVEHLALPAWLVSLRAPMEQYLDLIKSAR